MRRQIVLALAAMFVGFMGIAMMARTGRLVQIPLVDMLQLLASGLCLGAAITIFIRSVGNKSAAKSAEPSSMPLAAGNSGNA